MGNADQELMQRLAQGDAGAFETVFRTHYTLLLRYACKITGDKAAAEDVVQLVFANIWEGRKRLEVKQLKPYLLRARSEEHTSELQSRPHLVCRLLLEKKKKQVIKTYSDLFH